MGKVELLALLRAAEWLVPFYFAVRFRSWLTMIVVVAAWASAYLLANGDILAVSVIGAFNVPLIGYLLIDRMGRDPTHVKHVLSSQLHDARREIHDIRSDARAWEAKAVAYQRKLEQHGIR